MLTHLEQCPMLLTRESVPGYGASTVISVVYLIARYTYNISTREGDDSTGEAILARYAKTLQSIKPRGALGMHHTSGTYVMDSDRA